MGAAASAAAAAATAAAAHRTFRLVCEHPGARNVARGYGFRLPFEVSVRAASPCWAMLA